MTEKSSVQYKSQCKCAHANQKNKTVRMVGCRESVGRFWKHFEESHRIRHHRSVPT
jgi:hypothetical protein